MVICLAVAIVTAKTGKAIYELMSPALSGYEAERIGKMFQIVSDMERIGDHAENIAEYTIVVENNDLKFTEAAIEELKQLSALTIHLTNVALEAFELEDVSYLPQVRSLEKDIDKYAVEYTENHISRLKIASCEPKSGVIFTDMIVDLERSADHANNIAFSLLSEGKKSLH